jgi:putative endonuclease
MAFFKSPSAIWRSVVRRASASLLERSGLQGSARLGREGEEAAYWFLREAGMTMVARNYRPEGLRGEIDLIGWEGGTLVFVEVKARSSSDLQMPEAAVDREKQRNVKAAARQYLHKARQQKAPFRFDIVSVEMAPGQQPKINHLRDAFR